MPKPSVPFWQNVTDTRDDLKAKGEENNKGMERIDLQYQQDQVKEDYDENIPNLLSRVNELKDEYADEIGGEAQ